MAFLKGEEPLWLRKLRTGSSLIRPPASSLCYERRRQINILPSLQQRTARRCSMRLNQMIMRESLLFVGTRTLEALSLLSSTMRTISNLSRLVDLGKRLPAGLLLLLRL